MIVMMVSVIAVVTVFCVVTILGLIHSPLVQKGWFAPTATYITVTLTAVLAFTIVSLWIARYKPSP